MADVTVTPVNIDLAGANPSTNSSLSTSDTYVIRNDGLVFLQLKNTDTAQHSFTVKAQKSIAGSSVADLSVNVSAGSEVWIGPWPTDVWNDASDDLRVTVDNATGTEIGAYHLG